MKSFTALSDIPSGLPHPIVTIGNFDGVHRGHQEILKMAVAEARFRGGCSVVITFDPHPLRILAPAAAPALIMTPTQKLRAFSDHGIDFTGVLRFDVSFSHWSPRHFVENVLVRPIGAKKVLVGSNFVFGYQQRGNVDTLASFGKEFGFEVTSVSQFTWRRTRVSSSLIRDLLIEGHVQDANRLLGDFFTLEGSIVAGAARGRRLSFPTLNLSPENELIPKSGVYITQSIINSERFPSLTNIGVRPTFGESKQVVETHLIGVTEFPTPDRLSTSFLHRLRDERKFPNSELLREQIGRDVASAKRFFERLRKFKRGSAPGEQST